jgi:hypothetical protein
MAAIDDVMQAEFSDFGDVRPDDACVNYERCGNVVPEGGQMCGDCLDRVRHNADS